MLQQQASTKPVWSAVFNTNIDRWLADRQQLLVDYCELSSGTNTDDQLPSCAEKLRHLCQSLIDYVSAGHFGIYDQLMQQGREAEAKEALREAIRQFNLVDATTEHVLDFNDKYLETDDLSVLLQDLSNLGEVLETRFSAEDTMISVLHRNKPDPLQLN